MPGSCVAAYLAWALLVSRLADGQTCGRDPEDHTCNSGEDDAALLAHVVSGKRMLHVTEVGSPPSGDNLETCLKGSGSSRHTYMPDEFWMVSVGYNMKSIHNVRVTATIHPSAIVFATEESHVVVAVSCAYRFNKPVYGRSGMNQYEASCSNETGGGAGCVLVDTNSLQHIHWPASGCANGTSGCIVSLGPVLSLGKAYMELMDRRYTLPAGTCAGVRVAGLTLGGGKGWLTRKYGLTLDRLRGISAVLINGTKVYADSSTEEHLFWLARGGGGNVFPGVVTAFYFELVPLPVRVPAQQMSWDSPSHQCISSLLAQWYQQLATYTDHDLWSRLSFQNWGSPQVVIDTLYFGTEEAIAKQKLKEVQEAAGCGGKLQFEQDKDWLQIVREANGYNCPTGPECPTERQLRSNNCGWDLDGDMPRRTECHGYDLDWDKYGAYRSLVFGEKGVPQGLWDALAWTTMEFTPSFYIEIDPSNGAMGNIAPNATAYPHRGAGFVTLQQGMSADSREEIELKMAQSAALFKNLTQHAPEKWAYYNYLDKDMGAYGAVPRHSYYGANANRVESYVREYTEGISTQDACNRCQSWELSTSS